MFNSAATLYLFVIKCENEENGSDNSSSQDEEVHGDKEEPQ